MHCNPQCHPGANPKVNLRTDKIRCNARVTTYPSEGVGGGMRGSPSRRKTNTDTGSGRITGVTLLSGKINIWWDYRFSLGPSHHHRSLQWTSRPVVPRSSEDINHCPRRGSLWRVNWTECNPRRLPRIARRLEEMNRLYFMVINPLPLKFTRIVLLGK